MNRDLAGPATWSPARKPYRIGLCVILEEVAHFGTNGATDNNRDFQNFLLDLAVKLGRKSGQRQAAQA